MALRLNDSTPELLMVKLQDVDVPISALQTMNPGVDRFTASFILVRDNPDNPSQPQVLLIQRGHDGSWGGSWEKPGGGHEFDKDNSIMQTALRETKEEVGLKISTEAIFPAAYRTAFLHKGLQMASYTFIAELGREASITLSDEHLRWGFFDEESLRLFGPYEKEKAQQDGGVMLERKKEILRHFFTNKEQLKIGDVIMQVHTKETN
ncbi:hypothetical protein PENANT_c132G08727 [Penicillium antarcticum]|uniref:Nudix hydrolase domain-containing protein n=1 Tax=Penicillium antarcticum TaxID=416450 RepID=A0A1V6PGR9_9EURO|nr:hypothetical protein PENANT_c132G08727 [Penicillium antarcticum]